MRPLNVSYNMLDTYIDLPKLAVVDPSIKIISVSTSIGSIRIKLRPDWSESSVEYVQQV